MGAIPYKIQAADDSSNSNSNNNSNNELNKKILMKKSLSTTNLHMSIRQEAGRKFQQFDLSPEQLRTLYPRAKHGVPPVVSTCVELLDNGMCVCVCVVVDQFRSSLLCNANHYAFLVAQAIQRNSD
jgi:hypothetical protein